LKANKSLKYISIVTRKGFISSVQ